jgi:hypothetical protein
MHTKDVDQLLAMSDPAREVTAKQRRLAAEMAEQSAPAIERRFARPIAVGAVAAVLLGGGGMAAAAATGLWEGWAQNDALAILHYELPSGASCEWRIGNITGAPDEIDQIVRDTLADAQITAADIAEGAAYVGAAGDPLTDDGAFETGYAWAVNLRLEEAYADHGYEGQWWSIEGQGFCE